MLTFTRLRQRINEYPRQFWTLFVGSLINSTGNGLIINFISAYLTKHMGFTMTQVGLILVGFAITVLVSQLIGGGLIDRIGRKPIMMISLFGNALACITFGIFSQAATENILLRNLLVIGITILIGSTNAIFSPAASAMVIDLVKPAQRTSAFGLLRVVLNVGITVGPMIGGFIASYSYEVLFITAGVAMGIYALIITFFVQETHKREHHEDAPNILRSMGGFVTVLRDRAFVIFLAFYALTCLIYAQNNTTLTVFLINTYHLDERWLGLMMGVNAVMVVLFQYPLTRWLTRFKRGYVMAFGMILFAVGFGLFGLIRLVPLLFVAQGIWTLGELFTSPTAQSLTADAAPADQRGRYMGIYSLTFGAAYGIGPLLGGLVMDHVYPHTLWFLVFGIGMVVAFAYWRMTPLIQKLGARAISKTTLPITPEIKE